MAATLSVYSNLLVTLKLNLVNLLKPLLTALMFENNISYVDFCNIDYVIVTMLCAPFVLANTQKCHAVDTKSRRYDQ